MCVCTYIHTYMRVTRYIHYSFFPSSTRTWNNIFFIYLISNHSSPKHYHHYTSHLYLSNVIIYYLYQYIKKNRPRSVLLLILFSETLRYWFRLNRNIVLSRWSVCESVLFCKGEPSTTAARNATRLDGRGGRWRGVAWGRREGSGQVCVSPGQQ